MIKPRLSLNRFFPSSYITIKTIEAMQMKIIASSIAFTGEISLVRAEAVIQAEKLYKNGINIKSFGENLTFVDLHTTIMRMMLL